MKYLLFLCLAAPIIVHAEEGENFESFEPAYLMRQYLSGAVFQASVSEISDLQEFKSLNSITLKELDLDLNVFILALLRKISLNPATENIIEKWFSSPNDPPRNLLLVLANTILPEGMPAALNKALETAGYKEALDKILASKDFIELEDKINQIKRRILNQPTKPK